MSMDLTRYFVFATATVVTACASLADFETPEFSVPPAEVASKLSELFLSTSPDFYKPAGYRAPKAYGHEDVVHYSVVSLWVNALECAHLAGNADLEKRLVAAFEPAYGEKKAWMNDYRHVDLSIVGAIPLEIAILTGDERAKALGLRYADRQWEEPGEGLNWGERWYEKIPLEERRANWEKGYSPETRLWLDDMYMITLLQGLAYRLTGDGKYVERTAKEMCLYLEKLPRPDGLFNHSPGAPFAWGRGNGWLAAAMAMNLSQLPKDSEWRGPILAGYLKMMESLRKWQRPNGLWGQLVDDPESYDETSATAMFAYAFAEGARSGVLGEEYRAAAVRAYNALVRRLDEHGNLPDVCVGTGWKNDRHHYLTRPRANGDPHGQAPLLWLCRALMQDGKCAANLSARTFEIGERDFLLDGKPFVMRCGEIHYARIPREYWRHRLQMLRAMGCNAVGCYMFRNFHERERGVFNWKGRADAAEFCRMAQEEGLWVVLRPGPYSCAEWECGGAPWWLLTDTETTKPQNHITTKPISMRSSDPRWLVPATNWLHAVGRELAGLQVTKGGPILMVQVENEYGLHGNDVAYIRALRQAVLDAGFEVPLYACNPPRVIQNGFIPELFQAANFGAEPEQRFEIVRKYQPKGPLMCAEYYPAWFDTWGQAHHPPKSDREFFGPIDWMFEHRASFSLYMAHGGTSFGGWTGCRNPFVPNVTSYDYEAPINEHGRANPSFAKYRERAAKHLNPGETIPDCPEPIPVKPFGEVVLSPAGEVAECSEAGLSLSRPVYSEKLGMGFGLVLWTARIPSGVSGDLKVENVHDFGYVYLDCKRIGILDRRHRGVKVTVPPSEKERTLEILVEAMGRINSSSGMEDRKGLDGRVTVGGREIADWRYSLEPIDPDGQENPPGNWRGVFSVDEPADTFVDMRAFNKGIVWVNGKNLGRYWKIGPQQTLYLPGCWLKKGENEIVVREMLEPAGKPIVGFLDHPILDELHPEADFNIVRRDHAKFVGGAEVASGTFPSGDEAQVVIFDKPVSGNYFTLQATSSYDKKGIVSIAEFDFLDKDGNPLTSLDLSVTGVDSEEEIREDGVAENAIDGQVEAPWIASSRTLPHWIEFCSATRAEIYGFRYTPRQNQGGGRIKDWRFFAR